MTGSYTSELPGRQKTDASRARADVTVGLTWGRTARGRASEQRDGATDWVKGALVVLMVIYHSLNFSAYSRLAFRYLAFLPPAFIFIAGFLLTNSYRVRYDLRDGRLHRRLLVRGAKLVLLFSGLNLMLFLMAFGAAGLRRYGENWEGIYWTSQGRVASFYILSSIGYLLLLGPLLLWLCAFARRMVPLLTFGLFCICMALEAMGRLNYHGTMLSTGVIGMSFGLVPIENIKRAARSWAVVVPLYGLYRVAGLAVGEPYAVQVMGVLTTLVLLYGAALTFSGNGIIYRQAVLLGRYSLLGYIGQLAILQVITRGTGLLKAPLTVLAVTVVTGALTWALALLTDRLRNRVPVFDRAYKVVFA